MSTRDDDVEEFAALLRRLKGRTDRSYGALARRVSMNTSTLHRYCAGDAVPVDFAPVERFAVLCGATPEERLELHRRWILAVAARQRPRTQAAPSESPAPEVPETSETPGVAEAPETSTAPEATETPEAPETLDATDATDAGPRVGGAAWYRRRLTVTVAAASALIVTLGALSALSLGGSSDGASRTVGPSPATDAPDTLHRPSANPSAGRTGSPPADDSTAGVSGSGTPPKDPKTAKGSEGAKGSKGAGSSGGSGNTKANGGGSAAPPLTWTANSQAWNLGCGHDYVIRKDPSEVPPPPAPQDAGTWAATQGAVHGRDTNVEISVQGRSSTAVVLTALRVRVTGRTAPVPGTVYAMDHGCGGSITPRSFAVDLDKDRPIARSVPGNDAGTPIPAVRMPYRVSATDPEVLLVTARTQTCGCSWYLELDWSSEGRTGTVRVDDRGSPFRTSAIGGLPRYWYGTEGAERRWVPAG
ncbi:helix-turn-helix domain-containing protein [Streptomyces sp. MMBL 11-3]|uniref:helix-turn-helix domain-containing protein n=1 Tax=Streptomyces sp. MMBL 11-3 TaxID=3382639 RepID=UPI0039B50AAC